MAEELGISSASRVGASPSGLRPQAPQALTYFSTVPNSQFVPCPKVTEERSVLSTKPPPWVAGVEPAPAGKPPGPDAGAEECMRHVRRAEEPAIVCRENSQSLHTLGGWGRAGAGRRAPRA